MSRGDASLIDLLLPLADQDEHLTSDVAFQAPDHLKLGMALGHALCHVGLGSRVSPEPPDGNDVQGAVSSSITAPVEAVTHRLARRSRNRAYAAQCREARFRMQTLRVIPCRQEQLRSAYLTDRVTSHQIGGELIDDGADHSVQVSNLIVQFEIAAPQRLETDPIGGDDGAIIRQKKWSRQVRQFGGLAKVDPGCFYAASCSVISAVA